VVDDLSDLGKGQVFQCFHGYKQAHISLCAYCACVYSLFLFPFLFVVYFCMYVFFSFFLTTILVNKDVYIRNMVDVIFQVANLQDYDVQGQQ